MSDISIEMSVQQMAYTSTDMAQHSESVWIPAQFTIDVIDKRAAVMWYGYDSAIALQAKMAGSPVANIGQHQANITGQEFLSVYEQVAAGTITLQQAVAATAQAQDVDTGTQDANGNDVYASFFATATATTVTVTPSVGS